ncbi:adenosylmethionine decarboxylase [Burkholderia sp. SR8]|uniref:adenosylmethionine decarboxylase n=1 Tax=Burkholderia sp. SR8 TaxID=3062277 RepID=UPI0040647CA0
MTRYLLDDTPPPTHALSDDRAYLPSGIHMMMDAWGVPHHILNDVAALKTRMEKAVRKVGATLLKLNAVQFSPNGITVVAVLAESHASIHTYPEQGVLMADAFTCGTIDPEPLIEALIEGVNVSHRVIRRTARGDGRPTHIEEQLSSGLARVWEIEEVVAAERTAYQDVLIARTAHGMTLFCNRERQSSELTQLIYHEGQFIPAALLAGQRKRVLVIGSSEGVVVQLALWCGAEHVVHVDIDRRCVDLCAEHLPYGYSKRDVERYEKGTDAVHLLFEDGSAAVDRLRAENQRFDIVVMDLPDEELDSDQRHNRLYQRKFLEDLRDLLEPNGVVISQAGCASFWRNQTLAHTFQRFSDTFSNAVYFELTEQDWVWVIGCNAATPDPVATMQHTLKTLPYTPHFIDSNLIAAATVLPLGLRRRVYTAN